MQTLKPKKTAVLSQYPLESQITIADSGNVYWESDTRKRCIGKLVGDTFHCERIPERHLHRKSQAYGFNYELMRGGSFKYVAVHLPFGETILTRREYILRRGFFLKFEGFEKQIFLKLADFGLDKAREPEPMMNPPLSQLAFF